MASLIYPSSFKCDCGHQSDFSEGTVMGMEELSQRTRKPQVLSDAFENAHRIVFAKGKAISILCPNMGERPILGEATQSSVVKPRRTPVKKPTGTQFTRAQGRYLAFIDHYIKVHNKAPAEADMQAYFKTSPPTVHQMVITLERNNLISRTLGVARSIKVLVPPDSIPDIATGQPIRQIDRFPHVTEWLKVPGHTISLGHDPKTGTYARTFNGDIQVWNGGKASNTVDELLEALGTAIASQNKK